MCFEIVTYIFLIVPLFSELFFIVSDFLLIFLHSSVSFICYSTILFLSSLCKSQDTHIKHKINNQN
jgi:hypothetical protein